MTGPPIRPRWRERPLALVAAAALAVGALWMVLQATGGPLLATIHAIDERLLLAFRGTDPATPAGPQALAEVMRDITALGGSTVIVLLVSTAAALLALSGRRRQAIFLVVTVTTGVLLTVALKAGFDRPRPDLVPHGSMVALASFPSGHAATSAVAYLTLAAILIRAMHRHRVRTFILTMAALVTIAVGASRVYLGVHWPSDVVAGWLQGAGWALGAWLVERRLQARGSIEPQPPPQRR